MCILAVISTSYEAEATFIIPVEAMRDVTLSFSETGAPGAILDILVMVSSQRLDAWSRCSVFHRVAFRQI